MTTVPFYKMHGLGNDFVIFDTRSRTLTLHPEQLRAIAARRTGIGCDQIILIEPYTGADVFMRIYNADGSEVSACGNATRCIAWLMMQESGKSQLHVATKAGNLLCEMAGPQRVRADMGEPRLQWQDIPLSEARDTLHLGIHMADLDDPVAVSMGNPHAVFFVDDAAIVPLHELGPLLETHQLFPERANISVAQVLSDKEVTLRVWERGTGETLACGTAACATAVAMHRRGLGGRAVSVHLPGGELFIEWDASSNHVWMTGAVAYSFEGTLAL